MIGQEMTRDERKARSLINREYKGGRNLMTPNVIAYGMVDDTHAWELSWGTGIFSPKLFGVTVVNFDPETNETSRAYDMSTCFQDEQEAREYIAGLADGLTDEEGDE